MSCLFWDPLRPCGGGRRGRKAPTKPGPLAPALVWQAGGPKAPGRQTPPPPPGRPGYPSPRVQRRGEGGAAQPIPAPSPWACRVPLRLAAAAAAPRFRQGCGNRCGPEGGAAGAQSAHKAGAFGPGFGLAGGGLRPPAAKRRRPPRRASYRQQKPGQTKKASEPRPLLLLLMHQIRPQCGEIGD